MRRNRRSWGAWILAVGVGVAAVLCAGPVARAEPAASAAGFDGVIGERTRDAIRATQRGLDLAEDGHPSARLLERLRGSAAP